MLQEDAVTGRRRGQLVHLGAQGGDLLLGLVQRGHQAIVLLLGSIQLFPRLAQLVAQELEFLGGLFQPSPQVEHLLFQRLDLSLKILDIHGILTERPREGGI